KLLAGMAAMGLPVLPYFDIPFQHSHPDILARMGRPFKQDPGKVISLIREFFPEAALRTTLIVGYPGETARHFRHLEQFVQNAGFQHLGVFPFYPEEGTRAAGFSNPVSENEQQKRLDRIMSVQSRISAGLLAEYTDQTLDIMVDEPHPEWPGLYSGRAWFQAPEVDGMSYVSGPGIKQGEIVRARVHETSEYDLITLQEQE
ncbi:MAG: 30S ribosomal protein S12 methylthiotransferase RimO, partial [Desulfonatronovibrionaceae bacterium]